MKGRDADEAVKDREKRKETFQKQMKETFQKKGKKNKRVAHVEGRQKKLLNERKLDKILDAEEDEDAGREIIETKKKITLSAEQREEQKKQLHEIYQRTTYKKYLSKHGLHTYGTLDALKKRVLTHRKSLRMKKKRKGVKVV